MAERHAVRRFTGRRTGRTGRPTGRRTGRRTGIALVSGATLLMGSLTAAAGPPAYDVDRAEATASAAPTAVEALPAVLAASHAALRSCGSSCGDEIETARILGVRATRLLTRRPYLSGSMAHEQAWAGALWLAALPPCPATRTRTACAAHPDDAASRVGEAYAAVRGWLPERLRPVLDEGDPRYGHRYAGSYWDQRTKTHHVYLTTRLATDPVRQGGARIAYHLTKHSWRELLTGQARVFARWRLLAARGVTAYPQGFAQPDIVANRLPVSVDSVTPRTTALVRAIVPWLKVTVRAFPGPNPVPPADAAPALTNRLSWYRWVSATNPVDGIEPPDAKASQRLWFSRGQLGADGCNARSWRAVVTRSGALVLIGDGASTAVGCPDERGDDRLDKILSTRPILHLDGHTLTLRSSAGDAAFVADLSLPKP